MAKEWTHGTDHNTFIGNFIGTDASGTVSLADSSAGIDLSGAKHNVIQDNLISGNEYSGVSLSASSRFNHLRANRIGVAADGSPLSNGSDGVWIWSASNTVGGLYPEDGNVIAFNNEAGVEVWECAGNTIRRNAIYANAHAGIYLAGGGNNMLAAPIIASVSPSSVSGTACPDCIVEIFSDEEDEGKVYEGYAIADANGDWTWNGCPEGPCVTATATDQTGNTSTFAAPRMAWRHRIHLPLIMRGEN